MGRTVNWSTEEKVGFPNYSNVTIRGGGSVDIADDADFVEELTKLVADVEKVMSVERDRVNELLVDATS